MIGRTFALLSPVAVVLATLSGDAFGGPNEGGVLLLHTAPRVSYTTEQTSYCDAVTLTKCTEAQARIDGVGPHLLWVFAAFPEGSSPELAGLTFGLEYDSTRLTVGDLGTCADSELPTDDWPSPGSGTALTWTNPPSATLLQVYWMAVSAENPDPPVDLALTWHPSEGASFTDHSIPPVIDAVAAFGLVGFGKPGNVPCPAALRSSQPKTPTPEEKDLCDFPIELWIDPGNVLALEEQRLPTLISGEVVTLDWSTETPFRVDGFDYLPSKSGEPPLSESMIGRSFGHVPFIQDLSKTMSISDAYSRYAAAQAALSGHLARTYQTVLSNTGDPVTAVQTVLESLSHPLVVDGSARALTMLPDVSVIEFSYEGIPQPTRMDLSPTVRGAQRSLTHREACELAERLKNALSQPGDRVTLVRLHSGTMATKSGPGAEAYLEENR